MVSKAFLKFLQDFLCDMNHPDRRYLSAWLHPIDDLTGRPRFRLFIQADVELGDCVEEFERVFFALESRKDQEPWKYISGVTVLDRNREPHCYIEDIMVLKAEEAC